MVSSTLHGASFPNKGKFMLESLKKWLAALFGNVTIPPPITHPDVTIGNHDSIPETDYPNHSHPVKAEPELVMSILPVMQSLVVIPNGGVLTKADIINGVISVEAGYVNNPDDRGGETNCGITVAVAHQYGKLLRTEFKWDGTMKNLTKAMAYRIYELEYWTPLKLDDIYKTSPFLADKLFDLAVNCGKVRAAMWLQRALNAFNRKQKDYKDLVVDGGVGNMTLTALASFIKVRGKDKVVKTLLKALICQQGSHYLEISLSREDNETFTFGWFERLDHHIDLYMDR